MGRTPQGLIAGISETNSDRRRLLKWAAGGAAALATSSVTTSVAKSSQDSGATTLRIGLGGDAPGFNVLEIQTAPLVTVYRALWDPWIENDFAPDGRLLGDIPMLATAWEVIDEDRLTWQFKLREGATFDNGEPWNAEAAAWNVNYLAKSETSVTNFRSRMQGVFESVEVVDEYTLNLKTTQPFVIAPMTFKDIMCVPPGYFQEVGAEEFARNPVGIGQYKFAEWNPAEQIVLERNPNYWGGQATFDTVIFKPYTEDSTRLAALEAGEIDLAYNVPPDDAQRLIDQGLGVSWIPLGQGMNLTEKLTIDSPLTDKRVRQAMNYALNVDSLVNDIMLGYAQKLNGQIVGPSATGYNPDLRPYPYDPEKAKQLLTEAGYPDGFTIDFDTSQGRYSKQQEVSEWMVSEYAKVGITLNMHLFEWGALSDKMYSDQAAPTFYTGRNWFPMMDDESCLNMFECGDRRKQMCEPEFEKMMAAQRATFDIEERKQILRDIHAWLHDYAPIVWLFEAPDIFGYTPRLQNFVPTPDNSVNLRGVTLASS
jgi:peptide/nickel transport system substrate-binding protein